MSDHHLSDSLLMPMSADKIWIINADKIEKLSINICVEKEGWFYYRWQPNTLTAEAEKAVNEGI